MATQALVKADQRGVALLESDELATVQQLGKLFAASGFFSDAREMAQAAVKVLAGRELGIPPVAAMMGINVIKGKVALGGNLIASRIRAHGYDYRHKQFDATGCALEFLGKREADGTRAILGEASFTEEDAKAAGVFSDMYRKYPRNMYFNRAISNGAKWYCAEVFAGAPVYTPEELGAEVDGDGEVIHTEPTGSREAQKTVAERKIAEMQRAHEQQAMAPEPDQTNAVFHASDDDLPPELGGTGPIPPAPVVKPQSNGKPWANFKGMLECFSKLREAIIQAGGSEADYYGALDLQGARHANEFRDPAKALACYRALEIRLANIRQGGSGVAA